MSTDLVEADYLVRQQLSRPAVRDGVVDSRLGWIVVFLFFGLFLGFAAFARLDAAAFAEGRVAVAGNRQTVQHRDGGIVSALHVREGQHVQAGDVLIELAVNEIGANERALAAQVIGMEAQRARLLAEQAGSSVVPRPGSWASLDKEDATLADLLLAQQTREMAARRGTVSSQKRVLDQQAAQLRERITGLGRQMNANNRQATSYDEQLADIRGLADKGYASINRVRDLERAAAAMGSESANLAANAASAQQQIGETRMQALALESRSAQDVSEQLQEADDKLNELRPKWQAARKLVAGSRIRATATGKVVGLEVFTVGGVVGPGQKLMEIVPDAAPLVVEVSVSPTDADDLSVGQTAEVHFPSLHERNLPPIEGKITRISADSLEDQHTGARYFTAQVVIPAGTSQMIRNFKTTGEGLKAGLPAQVLVPLRRRTVFQYLLEPLNQALWRTGREH